MIAHIRKPLYGACIIIEILFILLNTTIVNAKSSLDLNTIKSQRGTTFLISDKYDGWVSNYYEEKDEGMYYIGNRLLISMGTDFEVQSGDYVNIKLENESIIPCIVGSIDVEIPNSIMIIGDSSKPFISLSSINEDWTGCFEEIICMDLNYKDTIRKEIVDFAEQYVGNPYVWGGESLTNGADCSGFVMVVYRNFGIDYLPHDAEAQANYGMSIEESDLEKGDLLFYTDDSGSIGHVAMYVGDGQIIHASNSAPYPDGGIKISQYNYRSVYCIRRLI